MSGQIEQPKRHNKEAEKKISPDCPDVLWGVMESSCVIDSNQRSSFAQHLTILNNFLQSIGLSQVHKELSQVMTAGSTDAVYTKPPGGAGYVATSTTQPPPLPPRRRRPLQKLSIRRTATRQRQLPPPQPLPSSSRPKNADSSVLDEQRQPSATDSASQSLLPVRFRVQHVQDVAQQAVGSAYILDMAVAGEAVLGLNTVEHDDGCWTSQIVELNPSDARNVRVLYDAIPGWGEGLAVLRTGELYVATSDVLLRITPTHERRVIRQAHYVHCRAAPDGRSVYAVRSVCCTIHIDTVVGGTIIKEIITEVERESYYDSISCGAIFKDNVVLLCSRIQHCVYKVSLTDGRVLASYGRKGHRFAGDLSYPHICCTDTDKNETLITDDRNNRLQIFNSRDERWSIIKVSAAKQQLERPWCAVVKGSTVIVRGGEITSKLWVLQRVETEE